MTVPIPPSAAPDGKFVELGDPLDPGDGFIEASCPVCRHKIPGTATCAAFPDGIPRAILQGEDPHTTPHKGDHGIQYEPPEPEPAP